MAPKSCRHATQALRIADFRRALRHHDALACELCVAPPVRGNSRSKTGAPKRGRRSPSSPPEPLVESNASDASGTSSSSSSAVETLNGWAPNAAWDDLYVCASCGYMGCLGKNHFMQHFQIHPKHFIGFHLGSRTLWCCPCRQEVEASKSKIQEVVAECSAAFDEIAEKQQRRVKNKLVTNPTLTPEDDDSIDSQRSYVYEDESRRALDIGDLSDVVDDESANSGGSPPPAERPRSITFGTDQSRALAAQQSREREREQEIMAELAKEPAAASAATGCSAPPVLGFSNLGNTCYFNAATQALLTAMHYFPAFIYEDEIIARIVDSPVAATLMMLNGTIIKKTRNLPPLPSPRKAGDDSGKKAKAAPSPVLTVAPLLKEVRKKFAQFRGHYQQDAHELFTSMLWAIDEEIDPPKPMPAKKDPSDKEEQKQQPELINLFVKTDTGETISLRVQPDASMEEIQALLAKKLALDDNDVFLQPSGARQTMSRRSMNPNHAPPTYSKANFVRTLFGGALTTEVRCRSCGHCSETIEDAFQLSLPIPTTGVSKYPSVKDCLQQFTVESHLLVESENGYDCEKCSRPPKSVDAVANSPPPPSVLRDATMRLRISELPRVLVLHLKRLGRMRKVTQHIQFDAMLDMAPHVEDDVLERHDSTLYELIAVVVHKGNKRSGHYAAYVSRKKLGSFLEEDPSGEDPFTKTTRSTMLVLDDPDHDWFYVSDTQVQSVTFDQVLKCEAYMLYYQQVAPVATTVRYTVGPVRDTELRESEIRITDDLTDRETSCWI